MSQTVAEAITVGDALDGATRRLAAAGIESPRRDARLLMAHALGLTPEKVFGYPERPLVHDALLRFQSCVARRAAREPVSRILGEREFWGLSFKLSSSTLDPRADSEILVEAILESLPRRDATLRILDLGTGSGCLLLALLAELPNASGLGLDIDAGAVATASGNARRLGLADRASWMTADWRQAGSEQLGRFDVVVCNPPYIAEAELERLAPEVALHDPKRALLAGGDGLEAYRAVAPLLAEALLPAGIAALELGVGQAPAVSCLVAAAGLGCLECRRDLAGVERCLLVGAGKPLKKVVGNAAGPD